MDSAPKEDLQEQLARFREEWKAEVQRTKVQKPSDQAPDTSSLQSPPSPTQEKVRVTLKADDPTLQASIPPSAITAATTAATKPRPSLTSHPSPQRPSVNPVLLTPKQRHAAEVYAQAISLEQSGDHAGATELYRKAFRMEDHVDGIYRMLELRQEIHADPLTTITATTTGTGTEGKGKHVRRDSHSHTHHSNAPHPHKPDVHHLIDGVRHLELGRNRKAAHILLHPLIAQWSPPLEFLPEDEAESIPIARFPDELLLYVLQMLDVWALERFALVSRKARIVTLDSGLWRMFVEELYIPPQISYDEEIDDLLEEYVHDYRRVYIEHPRVRLDGVYIAVCHYIRNGLSENAWVNISHLITYNRYLRFYPDGTVLSLLAGEELPPQQIIPLLKPGLKQKGFFIGQWRLEGTTVSITSLTDPSGLTSTSLRYTFQMTLELRSRPSLGRWNRLDMKGYDSVNVETGEATPVSLKHDRPFWFSKVRSYG